MGHLSGDKYHLAYQLLKTEARHEGPYSQAECSWLIDITYAGVLSILQVLLCMYVCLVFLNSPPWNKVSKFFESFSSGRVSAPRWEHASKNTCMRICSQSLLQAHNYNAGKNLTNWRQAERLHLKLNLWVGRKNLSFTAGRGTSESESLIAYWFIFIWTRGILIFFFFIYGFEDPPPLLGNIFWCVPRHFVHYTKEVFFFLLAYIITFPSHYLLPVLFEFS